MDDFSGYAAIADPASVLVGLGAICGLIAAWLWSRVSSSIDTSGQEVKGPDKRELGLAATFTSLALGLACVGYLLGRFTGRF